MKSFNPDRIIKTYLDQIDSGPLLTRGEEEQLVHQMEDYQNKIIESFVKCKFSRQELSKHLRDVDTNDDVIAISKKLDDESSEASINAIRDLLQRLIVCLESNDEHSKDLLSSVLLSAQIVHKIMNEIRKKHSLVMEAENQLDQVRKWFDQRSLDGIKEIITEIRKNKLVRDKLRIELRLSDLQMLNKCGEWEGNIKFYESIRASIPEDISFKEIKDSFKNMNTLEFQMKRYKDQLVERNLRLVIARAKRLLGHGLEFEDLIQEGNLGLIKAIEKYDITRKTKIATYATWWIDQSMRRAISNKSRTVRIPTHIEWLQESLKTLVHKMTGELGRPPTIEEISERSGKSVETLEKLETRALWKVSIYEENNSGRSLEDVIATNQSSDPLTIVENKLMGEDIRKILSNLTERNEKIIRLRFGIGEVPDELSALEDIEEPGLTLQAIGDHVGLTKQGIRMIEKKSLERIKEELKKWEEDD